MDINEDPINPGFPICDPHHHLWDYPDSLSDNGLSIAVRQQRHYLLGELLQDITGGHNVIQTVFIECKSMYHADTTKEMAPIGETEFAQGIAAQSASGRYGSTRVAAGIVGYADLALGTAVEPVLEAHVAASRNRFRGIRYVTANSPQLLMDSKFRQGFALLQKYNLSFDAGVFHTQLLDLTELAEAFPNITIILIHFGVPLGVGSFKGKRDIVLRDWKKAMAELSRCPNVFVKLGGMGISPIGFGWDERPTKPDSEELATAITPYFEWCIEKFGPTRCMFESNFPVDKVSFSYTTLWNAYKNFTKNYSPTEKADLFFNTAVRAYRLKPQGMAVHRT